MAAKGRRGDAAGEGGDRESTSRDPDTSPDGLRADAGPAPAFGRTVVPPQLLDRKLRAGWRLPEAADVPGAFVVELNLQHAGGLPAAEAAFRRRFAAVVMDPHGQPERIGKSYLRCSISLNDVMRLAEADARASEGRDDARAIYRIWPDFPVRQQMDRSVATVKADAALRAYDAGGGGITWAVIDSGIDVGHPHFGGPRRSPRHLLLADDVRDLHRCFARLSTQQGAVRVPVTLPDPDTEPATLPDGQDWQSVRNDYVELHRSAALGDELGHGTHVAGIIAGGPWASAAPGAAPAEPTRVFMREYQYDASGQSISRAVVERDVPDVRRLRGVAPECKLVSLRVLDGEGEGRASDIIRALEYVREKLNDNPKMLRVHGVNLSVGYEFDAELFACGQSPLCAEVDRLVRSGVVVVCAAGNTGYGTAAADQRATRVGFANTINDPGNAAHAITVGSTHRDAPHTYGVSYFSSKGPTGDGRLKPDLLAPGERITSCAAGKKLAEVPAPLRTKDGQDAACYIDDSGTSMAAPHVSGAIAAFLSIRREFIGKPEEVKRIFLQSATCLGRERYFQGHGLVDLMRAIQSV